MSGMPSAFPPDLTDAELMDEARATSRNITYVGTTYLEELNRRAVDRQTQQLITLTAEIKSLTGQVRWLTVAAVVLAVIAVVVAVLAIVMSPG